MTAFYAVSIKFFHVNFTFHKFKPSCSTDWLVTHVCFCQSKPSCLFALTSRFVRTVELQLHQKSVEGSFCIDWCVYVYVTCCGARSCLPLSHSCTLSSSVMLRIITCATVAFETVTGVNFLHSVVSETSSYTSYLCLYLTVSDCVSLLACADEGPWGDGTAEELHTGVGWSEHDVVWYKHHVCVWGVGSLSGENFTVELCLL